MREADSDTHRWLVMNCGNDSRRFGCFAVVDGDVEVDAIVEDRGGVGVGEDDTVSAWGGADNVGDGNFR